MFRFRRRQLLSAAACAAAALLLDAGPSRTALAHGAPRAWAEVVLLAGAPMGDVTNVYRVPADAPDLPPPIATIHHRPGGAVRGVTLTDGGVAVVADTAPGDDLSFVASLLFVGPRGGTPKVLCDRAVHASRPVALPDGRVAVARGTAGSAPLAGGGREDDLAIDALDPTTGHAETLLARRGFLLFPAGLVDGGLLVYALASNSAELLLVDLGSRTTKTLLAKLPPFARDFDVDPRGHRIVFVDRHPTDARNWQVLSLDLGRGATSTLAEGPSLARLPFVLDDGTVATTEGDRVERVGGGSLTMPGPGVFQLLGRDTRGGRSVLAGLVTRPGQLGRPIVMRGDGLGATWVPSPTGERVAVAGVIARGAR